MNKLICASALVIAGLFAVPASAQQAAMTINGAAIPETEMAGVQQRCAELLAGVSTEASGTTTEGAGSINTDASTGAAAGASANTGTQGAGNSSAESKTGATGTGTATIDLDTLSAETCTAGGFTAN